MDYNKKVDEIKNNIISNMFSEKGHYKAQSQDESYYVFTKYCKNAVVRNMIKKQILTYKGIDNSIDEDDITLICWGYVASTIQDHAFSADLKENYEIWKRIEETINTNKDDEEIRQFKTILFNKIKNNIKFGVMIAVNPETVRTQTSEIDPLTGKKIRVNDYVSMTITDSVNQEIKDENGETVEKGTNIDTVCGAWYQFGDYCKSAALQWFEVNKDKVLSSEQLKELQTYAWAVNGNRFKDDYITDKKTLSDLVAKGKSMTAFYQRLNTIKNKLNRAFEKEFGGRSFTFKQFEYQKQILLIDQFLNDIEQANGKEKLKLGVEFIRECLDRDYEFMDKIIYEHIKDSCVKHDFIRSFLKTEMQTLNEHDYICTVDECGDAVYIPICLEIKHEGRNGMAGQVYPVFKLNEVFEEYDESLLDDITYLIFIDEVVEGLYVWLPLMREHFDIIPKHYTVQANTSFTKEKHDQWDKHLKEFVDENVYRYKILNNDMKLIEVIPLTIKQTKYKKIGFTGVVISQDDAS